MERSLKSLNNLVIANVQVQKSESHGLFKRMLKKRNPCGRTYAIEVHSTVTGRSWCVKRTGLEIENVQKIIQSQSELGKSSFQFVKAADLKKNHSNTIETLLHLILESTVSLPSHLRKGRREFKCVTILRGFLGSQNVQSNLKTFQDNNIEFQQVVLPSQCGNLYTIPEPIALNDFKNRVLYRSDSIASTVGSECDDDEC